LLAILFGAVPVCPRLRAIFFAAAIAVRTPLAALSAFTRAFSLGLSARK
jgi:hypothetical protein